MTLFEYFNRLKKHHHCDGEITAIDVNENEKLVKISVRFFRDISEEDIYLIREEIMRVYRLEHLIILHENKPRRLNAQEILDFVFEETKKNSFVSAVKKLNKKNQYSFTLDIYGTRQSYTTKLSIHQFEDIDENLDKILEMIKNKWIDEFCISVKTLTLEGCVCC